MPLSTDKAPKGYQSYKSINLAPDTALKAEQLKKALNDAGALFLSAGGTRSLTATVGPGRSMASMHYLGRAFDLPPYAGAFQPLKDPYVVTPGPQQVLARVYAPNAPQQIVQAYSLGTVQAFKEARKLPEPVSVSLAFVNLTQLAVGAGFVPIEPRSSFFKGHYGSWEWWHFEDRQGLKVGTRFLDLIPGDYRKLPHWPSVQKHTWNGSFFSVPK